MRFLSLANAAATPLLSRPGGAVTIMIQNTTEGRQAVGVEVARVQRLCIVYPLSANVGSHLTLQNLN